MALIPTIKKFFVSSLYPGNKNIEFHQQRILCDDWLQKDAHQNITCEFPNGPPFIYSSLANGAGLGFRSRQAGETEATGPLAIFEFRISSFDCPNGGA
jgi:hypothetical protein